MLPIALGDATKTVPFVMDGAKTYRFTIGWGAETTTDDLEGAVVNSSPMRPSVAEIEAVLDAFRGEIEQVPPAFSAIKVAGERAYDLAREGETVELAPRRVQVRRLEIIGDDVREPNSTSNARREPMSVRWRAISAAGSAVSAMSRKLRRIAVGPFAESDMVSLDRLLELEGDLAALDALLLAGDRGIGRPAGNRADATAGQSHAGRQQPALARARGDGRGAACLCQPRRRTRRHRRDRTGHIPATAGVPAVGAASKIDAIDAIPTFDLHPQAGTESDP